MAKKVKQSDSSLIQALEFISHAQREIGTEFQTHCTISNKTITGSDGIITAGTFIEEDLECCPHTHKLLSALTRCNTLSMTLMENTRLSLKSGKFSAIIPCLPDASASYVPDPPCAQISDVLRDAFGAIHHLVEEKSEKVVTASILLEKNRAVATNGFVMLAYWHGIDLPPIALPKAFTQAICAIKKKITGFGFSGSSCTFWFEDSSWIKTQLFAEPWPDIDRILGTTQQLIDQMTDIPPKFYESLRTIEDFAVNGKEKGFVTFIKNGIKVGNDDTSATFDIKGLPEGYSFRIKYLKMIEHCIAKIAFHQKQAYFYSGNICGTIMGMI